MLADRNTRRAHAVFRKRAAELSHAVFAADEREDPPPLREREQNRLAPAVERNGEHILVRRAEPRAEAGERAQPRQHRDTAAGEQRQELLRAAEKAGVAGHNDRERAVFRVRKNVIADILRRDGGVRRLSGRGGGFDHPRRADETLGAGQRFARLAGERGAAAGAEPHDGDLRLCGKAEPAAEKLHRFRGGEPLALRRTADDDRHRARFRRGGDLFFKSSGAAGGLRYEIRRADAPEHGGVEFPGKRPLHCENVRRRQARLTAGAERILHRQHAGVSTRSEIADGRKGVQLPAAGRKQDVPVHAVEILRRSGGVLDKDGVFRRSRVGPQEPEILRVRAGTGRGDALGDALGVRVRRVDDKIEALAAEELRHLLARQRPRGNVQPLSLREQRFAVFRSHAHGHVRALPGEKLGDLASLGRAGKYAELRHPAPLCGGSRAASPSRRRSFSSWRCR